MISLRLTGRSSLRAEDIVDLRRFKKLRRVFPRDDVQGTAQPAFLKRAQDWGFLGPAALDLEGDQRLVVPRQDEVDLMKILAPELQLVLLLSKEDVEQVGPDQILKNKALQTGVLDRLVDQAGVGDDPLQYGSLRAMGAPIKFAFILQLKIQCNIISEA